MRRRLDAELVRRGMVASRSEALQAIRAGKVSIGGRPTVKAGTLVLEQEPIALAPPARRFASRGGEKLEAGLERFGVDVSGRDALDAGASTGGFTDCLLSRGARRVIAVDVGYGQLAWALREDPRITVLERTNVRDLTPAGLPFAPEVVTADLSFISLRLALPALAAVARAGADVVLLVKPQFEAGRAEVGRRGVVRDPRTWRRAVEGVADAARAEGLRPLDVMASPLPGPAGNVEFLLHARLDRGADGSPGHPGDASFEAALDRALAEGAGLVAGDHGA